MRVRLQADRARLHITSRRQIAGDARAGAAADRHAALTGDQPLNGQSSRQGRGRRIQLHRRRFQRGISGHFCRQISAHRYGRIFSDRCRQRAWRLNHESVARQIDLLPEIVVNGDLTRFHVLQTKAPVSNAEHDAVRSIAAEKQREGLRQLIVLRLRSEAIGLDVLQIIPHFVREQPHLYRAHFLRSVGRRNDAAGHDVVQSSAHNKKGRISAAFQKSLTLPPAHTVGPEVLVRAVPALDRDPAVNVLRDRHHLFRVRRLELKT